MLQMNQFNGFGSPDKCRTLKTAQFFYAPILPEGCLVDRSTGTTQSAVGDPVGRLVNFGTIGGFAAAASDAIRGTKEINTRAGVRGTPGAGRTGGYVHYFTQITAPVIYIIAHLRIPKGINLGTFDGERIVSIADTGLNDFDNEQSMAFHRNGTSVQFGLTRYGVLREFTENPNPYRTRVMEGLMGNTVTVRQVDGGTKDSTSQTWTNTIVTSRMGILTGVGNPADVYSSTAHLHAIAIYYLQSEPTDEFRAQARREMQALCATPNCEVLASNEVWMDLQDTSNMWQDLARTTAVTASGQPVASIRNKGRLGGFLESTDSGTSRPTYEVSGGYGRLSGPGESSGKGLALTVPAYNPRQGSIAAIVRDQNGGDNVFAWVASRTGNDASRQLMHVPYSGTLYMDANASGAGRVSGSNTATAALADFVMTVSDDPTIGSRLWKNNTLALSNTTVGDEAAQFNFFMVIPAVGAEAYSVVASRKTWTDQERASIRAALREQVGI